MTEYNGFKLSPDGTFGYIDIKPIGKGSVPMELRGSYTTSNFAQKAIDSYNVSNKGKRDGKDSQPS